ncbi:RNA polymerase II mediator complex protein (Med7), putative [Talaromyces stipitatus ATCC 10500]|uniref:Mediator of RNA polymerase II transcription subunit 7 n=1 Tax=Talaromyces stipitatus (strain ATCC 10500 / CBS 375.48 / QM 6759 / NRRL 1006) TaxID=441959 RepID=B8M979_TALSN|nr:RNA polymerase II mediator complex protein (Med7), putative [Talaromyces stipitatus ATCC 10500]EED17374.1 RNA polymerase II mediator complex protein (Med7), putative [Talaromyces stipitatus ATCC 10500]
MADAQRSLTAPFPPPPPFWKHFTTENIEKLEKIKKESNIPRTFKGKKWHPSELRALDVPPELRYLIPPEPPTEGSYAVFGELQSLSTNLPSLNEQGIEQLYPDVPTTNGGKDDPNGGQPLNHAYYLLKISKSLLLNFLEFVGVLSIAPEDFEAKLGDLRNLFINAHHLLNLYRPHQARESLILMMEEQLESARSQIQEMDDVKNRVERLLEQLTTEGLDAQQSSFQGSNHEANTVEFDNKAVEEARKLWDLLKDEDD